jgi:SAM-dependent methyltransferase
MRKQTRRSINNYANSYNTKDDFDRYFIDFRFKCLKENIKKLGNVLELGCANGLMTKRIVDICDRIDVVEGSTRYINDARKEMGKKIDKVRFFNMLFSEFFPDKKYDTIILSSVLHEVDSPIKLLKKISQWCKKGTIIYINVPNALSLHRRIGKIMGILKSEYSFSTRDKKFCHKRIYDLKKLKNDVINANLKIIKNGGYFLKIFSNKQLNKFDYDFINSLYTISKNLPPEICAEIYIFAKI